MASGFGFHGGRSRCFTHWQEFQKCYSQADIPGDCGLQADDYIECLHHKKEIERNRTIRDTFLERQAHEAKQAQEKGELRTTSSVLRLGIIGREGESDSSSSSGSGDGGESRSSGKEPQKGSSKRDDK